MNEPSDRNLLFGVLAVQLEFINSSQLVEIANKWMLNKQQTLGELLVQAGWLTSDDCKLLDAVVAKHVARTGSPEESLRRVQDVSGQSEISKATEFVSQFHSPSSPNDSCPTMTWMTVGTGATSERFDLLRELARGGLGEVFVAQDRELDREVALKKILNDKDVSVDIQQRFVSEAKITGSLEHPGVVPVYALGTFSDGRPFYAMRLIRGNSLFDAIQQLSKKKPQLTTADFDREFRQLVRAVIEACYAIGYAHSRGVLHRDIKPHNIMLGKYGETLVVDWGLAKVVGVHDDHLMLSEPPMDDVRSADSGPTRLGTVMGTPNFMSPEQAHGQLDVLDWRSDVFSLGATLYMVATEKMPYQSAHRHDVLRAAQNCDYPSPRTVNPGLSKVLEAICLKAMAKEPEQRYQTALELADDLDAWIAGAPVSAYPESLTMRAFRFARKHQTAVASLLVFLLVSSVALVIANSAISFQRDEARIQRDDALQARRFAQVEREKAEEATKVARHNTNVSIEILDQFVKTLSDDKWSQIPNVEADRMKMVELALDRFSQLLAESPNDLAIKKQVCQLLIRSANIYRSRGDDDKAIAQIERGKTVASELMDQVKDDPLFFGLYSDALVYASIIHEKKNGPDRALQEANLAVEASRKRVAIKEDTLSSLGLALSLSRRAEVHCNLSRYPAAITDFEETIEKLLPSKSKFRMYLLPSSQLSLAEVYCHSGQTDDALRTAQAALANIEPVLAKNPDSVDLMAIRAGIVKVLAMLEIKREQYAEAKEHIEQSVQALTKVTEAAPDNVNLKRQRIESQQVAAELALRQGQRDLCHELANKVIDDLKSLSTTPEDVANLRSTEIITLALMVALSGEDSPERLARKNEYESCREQLQQRNPNDPALVRAAKLMSIR